MPQKLNLLGAHIRHARVCLRENGTFARISFSVGLTAPLAKRLECPEALTGDSYKRMNLETEEIALQALSLVKQGLEKHTLEIVAEKARDFIAVRVHEEESSSVERELRFNVVAPGATIALVNEYLEAIGEGRGKLTLTLGPQQQELAAE